MKKNIQKFLRKEKNHGTDGRQCGSRAKRREKQIPLIERCLVNIDLMASYTEKKMNKSGDEVKTRKYFYFFLQNNL